LQVWDFQSVTRALSALGSVSASRSVRSGRFYCIIINYARDVHVAIIYKHLSLNLNSVVAEFILAFVRCLCNTSSMNCENADWASYMRLREIHI